ncbi:unnamed protein product [Cuscuta epithymum]|uniref:Uncharacterized protein n=1 Tax=Cuscuta epithymum TaxID=186058 RepID=A0AAV0GFW7_9ASTE|nr:unnamed protein product [Cuscuta epithymum]
MACLGALTRANISIRKFVPKVTTMRKC